MKVENLPRFINEFNKQVKTIESLTAERDKMKAERDELIKAFGYVFYERKITAEVESEFNAAIKKIQESGK